MRAVNCLLRHDRTAGEQGGRQLPSHAENHRHRVRPQRCVHALSQLGLHQVLPSRAHGIRYTPALSWAPGRLHACVCVPWAGGQSVARAAGRGRPGQLRHDHDVLPEPARGGHRGDGRRRRRLHRARRALVRPAKGRCCHGQEHGSAQTRCAGSMQYCATLCVRAAHTSLLPSWCAGWGGMPRAHVSQLMGKCVFGRRRNHAVGYEGLHG